MARPKRAPTRRVKHIPQRTCVGCRTVLAKRQLLRLVRTADGTLALDPTGKAPGRGAYLHDRRSCWVRALSGPALDRALRVNLTEAERARWRAHGEQYSDDDAA